MTPILPVPHDLTRGRYIHETARSLSRLADVRVYFQQPRYPRIPGLAPRSFLQGEVGRDYRLDGIDVEAFTYPAIPGVSRVSNGWMASRALLPRLHAFSPDIVLAYWLYPDGDAACRAARRLGVPCIVGARGSDVHVRSGINAMLTRRTIRGADAMLTVSRAMRAKAIEDFGADPSRVHAIVNGIDTSIFHPRNRAMVRGKLGIEADAKVIAYVGRYVEAKGMRELLVAFGALAARDPALRLALVGDGVMRNELQGLVREQGISDRVTMTGGLSPVEVAEWICAANVLTLPSWSEGYPNVVVEGIACGVPVVATSVGGTGEIIDASNGIMVPPRDAEALREGLSQALARDWDGASMASAAGRGWDDVAAETLAVCERVMAQAMVRASSTSSTRIST